MYSFNKVGKNILFTNGEINALIPEADFSVVAGAGTTIIITILNCKVTPSLAVISKDSDGTGTIEIEASSVDFPVAASAGLLATKLTQLLGFEFPLQGGSTGDTYQKASNDDFDYTLAP